MPEPDPQLMAMMAGAGGPPGGGAPPPGGGGTPPIGAPMSTPQPGAGEKQGGMLKIQQAMDLLEMSLPDFGSETEEGAAIIQVLGNLGKKFGGENRARSKELMPAELMNLMSQLPQGPGGMQPVPGAGGGAPMPGGGAPGGAQPMPPIQ